MLPRTEDALFQVQYEVLKTVDQHPCGIRVQSVLSSDGDAAQRKIAQSYDVALNGDFLRIDEVIRFDAGRKIVEFDRFGNAAFRLSAE